MTSHVGPRKTKGNYVLPNVLAKALTGISPRTQYEATILSLLFILSGLVFTSIYVPFFLDVSRAIKFMTVFNSLAGLLFLSSMLATTYQQYKSYLSVTGLLIEEDDEDGCDKK